MVVAFPPDVAARLARIEADEGVPGLEVVHQATAIWTQLDAEERRTLGLVALHMVVNRLRRPR